MLIDLAGPGGARRRARPDVEGGGWAIAFKEAGLPPPDASNLSFSGQEMSFAWRSHFVAASVAPLSEATRERRTQRLDAVRVVRSGCCGVPDALISMFGERPMTMNFAPGDLVRARGREWVALPSPQDGILALRPLSGGENDMVILDPKLEILPVEPARFDLPATPLQQFKRRPHCSRMRCV